MDTVTSTASGKHSSLMKCLCAHGSCGAHFRLNGNRAWHWFLQASETSNSAAYRQRAALQELKKEQDRQSLSASGTQPAASQPDLAQADKAAISGALQKGEQGEHESEPLPVRGAPNESAHAAKQHQAVPQGDTQEGFIRAPRRKLLSLEQSSDAQQRSTGEPQPEQAGPQPSAFSRAGDTSASAEARRPRQRAAGPDSAKSLAPAAVSEAPGSSRQGSDLSIPQSR